MVLGTAYRSLQLLAAGDHVAQPERCRLVGTDGEHRSRRFAGIDDPEPVTAGLGHGTKNQPAGSGLGVAGHDDFGIGIDHRDGNGLGVALGFGPESGLLGQSGSRGCAQVVQQPVPPAHGLADVAHARALLEDDVSAGKRNERGDPQGSLVDIGDRFHVLDLRKDVRHAVAGRLGPPRAVDFDDEQVLLLLAGILDFSRQERDGDVVEQPFELDPFRAHALAQSWVVDRRAAAQLVHARQLGRALGGALAEAFLPRSFCRQDAAGAGVPCRAFLGHMMRFLELLHILRKNVMDGPVGRANHPQVGVAVEHAQRAGRAHASCGSPETAPGLAAPGRTCGPRA